MALAHIARAFWSTFSARYGWFSKTRWCNVSIDQWNHTTLVQNHSSPKSGAMKSAYHSHFPLSAYDKFSTVHSKFTRQYQPFTHLNTKTPVLLVLTWLCSKTLCNLYVPPEASVNRFEHGLPLEKHSGLTPQTFQAQMKPFRPPLQTNAFLTVCFVLQVIRRAQTWINSLNTSHKTCLLQDCYQIYSNRNGR